MYYVVYFEEESCYDVCSDSQIVYDGPPPVVGQKVEAAYKLRSGGSRSLYEATVVHIAKESCYDVCSDSQIVYDGPPPVVGQKVEAAYKLRSGGSRSLYEATVVHIANTTQEAETLLGQELKTASDGVGLENEEPNKGRGKREKKRKSHVLLESDELDKEMKKEKKSICNINLKEMKRRELIKLAKDLKPKHCDDLIDHSRSSDQKLIRSLQEENDKLSKKVKQLEKEKADAIDLGKWLESAQAIATEMKKAKDNTCFPYPTLSLPSSTSAPSTALSRAPAKTLSSGENRPICDPLSTPTSRPKEYPPHPSFPSPIQTLSVGPTESASSSDLLESATDPESSEVEDFMYKGSDNDVVELVEKTGVYINRTTLNTIKMSSKSHSTIARSLLSAVFTKEALETCSLMGKGARGPKGKPEFNRRALPFKGVTTIFEASTLLAQDQNIPLEDRKIITKSLGTKLSECRNKHLSKKIM